MSVAQMTTDYFSSSLNQGVLREPNNAYLMRWKGCAFPSASSLTPGSSHSGAGGSMSLNSLFRVHRMHVSQGSRHISVLVTDIPSLDVGGAYGCLSTVTREISSS